MRVGEKSKAKMRFVPRYKSDQASRRPEGVYYNDWCCSTCYWDWGRSWEGKHGYNHKCAHSNFQGLLKKHWKQDDPTTEDEQ